jgi:hypothetical protein
MNKTLGSPAESSESYAKLGMIEIARYRFRAFEMKFQREPQLHEALFFDESNDRPIKADLDTTRRQLAEAASASKIKLEPILKFLGLVPLADNKSLGAAEVRRAAKSRRSRRQPGASRRAGSGESWTWERFLADHRLHRRHSISGEELKRLSQVSFLGQARSLEDYLFILKIIRQGDQLSGSRDLPDLETS